MICLHISEKDLFTTSQIINFLAFFYGYETRTSTMAVLFGVGVMRRFIFDDNGDGLF